MNEPTFEEMEKAYFAAVVPGTPVKKIEKVYHSKLIDDYGTPKEFVDLVSKLYGPFDLDPCADHRSTKAPIWFGPQEDGTFIDAFETQWFGKTFCNPPYSQIDKYALQQIYAVDKGWVERSVGLVAARTDTVWFQALSSYACKVLFLKGRLKFDVYLDPEKVQAIETAILQNLGTLKLEDHVVKALALEFDVPKTVFKALLVALESACWDPSMPLKAESAPFPSAVLVFDRQVGTQSVGFWDWKKGGPTETSLTGYKYGPTLTVSEAAMKAGQSITVGGLLGKLLQGKKIVAPGVGKSVYGVTG